MHAYIIIFNITNITKLTTNQKLAKTGSVAWRTTHSRQAVKGNPEK